MREIKEIYIHCTATQAKSDIDIDWLRRLHTKERGWRDVGYHYLIKRSGEVQKGRDDAVVGAHVSGHNSKSIGIALAGGVDADLQPENNFTNEQFTALVSLLKELIKLYPGVVIRGHNEVSSKACPSFDVQQWLKDVDFYAMVD